jgi:VCBS repeat-containing protein
MINISAVNEPFTGGIEARNYQMVTPQNIESVTANIKASLGKSEQAALQTQVRQGETLISPLPCQQTVTPNHHPGEEAAQVQVTVSETCTGTVYITQSYQEKIAQIINQQANTQLGTGYQETGAVQESITHVTPKDKQQTAIQVNLAGTYAYQFTQEQQQTISALVKGKSKAQATTALLQDPDVQSVSISIDKGTTIPTQSNAIRLIILPVG